jgi:hypothetical protein
LAIWFQPTKVLQPAAEAAGLGRVTWHQCRHIQSSLLNDPTPRPEVSSVATSNFAPLRRETRQRPIRAQPAAQGVTATAQGAMPLIRHARLEMDLHG